MFKRRAGGIMVDAIFSPESPRGPRGMRRQLSVFVVGLAVILIGLGWVLLQRGFSGNSPPESPLVATPAPEQVSKELLETTKGLRVTQQQAVDQLQVVQDQLVAQKAETQKLSEQIAALTEKLNGVQVSAPTSN
jgi:uncharacterized coiled-coil protein SlyX